MSYGLKIEVWGKYALFSRPELKSERMSYEIITPSAARGLVESIYWHPGLKILIDRVYLLEPYDKPSSIEELGSPIKYASVRRNEIKRKISAKKIESMMKGKETPYINAKEDIVQRAATVLKDVHYVIQCHFELTDKATENDNEGKFKDIFRRRLEKGQSYSQPYFGCREFPANFKAWDGGDIPCVDFSKDLGIMLYDMDYSDPEDIKPMFFHAELEHGVMEIAGKKVLT